MSAALKRLRACCGSVKPSVLCCNSVLGEWAGAVGSCESPNRTKTKRKQQAERNANLLCEATPLAHASTRKNTRCMHLPPFPPTVPSEPLLRHHFKQRRDGAVKRRPQAPQGLHSVPRRTNVHLWGVEPFLFQRRRVQRPIGITPTCTSTSLRPHLSQLVTGGTVLATHPVTTTATATTAASFTL